MSKVEAFVLVDKDGACVTGPFGSRPDDTWRHAPNADHMRPEGAPHRWVTLTEWPQCRGITDNRCDYLASCGCTCNKCGREHNGMRRPVEQPSHPAVQGLTDNTRPAFEAYFAWSRKSKGVAKRPTFERFEDGTYKDDHTQRHWWTWQQALTAAAGAQDFDEQQGSKDSGNA